MRGSVEVEGQLSYASQDAWVYSNTLQENVLFGQPLHQKWYNTVIRACSLDKVRLCNLICTSGLNLKVGLSYMRYKNMKALSTLYVYHMYMPLFKEMVVHVDI